MPSLGADMEAGTLVEWLKKPGEKVERGDIVAVVDTQKGAIEIEIFESGVIQKILVDPGEKVPVGTVLAVVNGGPAETKEVVRTPAPQQAREPVERRPTKIQAAEPTSGRVRISPAARKRAAESGLALETIIGTGAGGAITLSDVDKAASAARTERAAAERPTPKVPRDAMRQAIGAAMTRSKREIPHYYLDSTIDMSRTLKWLEIANRDRPVTGRLLPGVLLLKAVALALKKVPELNGSWVDDRFQPGEKVHVGWAVSLRGGGLIAPAIHNADKKSVDELMPELRDIVKRARAGGLRSSELSDATVTITSLGDQGVETVLGVIYPPQVALVGFGSLVIRPVAVGDAVAAHPVIRASLAGDHRASDGHSGAKFLNAVDRLLQGPEAL